MLLSEPSEPWSPCFELVVWVTSLSVNDECCFSSGFNLASSQVVSPIIDAHAPVFLEWDQKGRSCNLAIDCSGWKDAQIP